MSGGMQAAGAACPAWGEDERKQLMENLSFVCSKCGGSEYETDEFRVKGGSLKNIFDVRSKRFTTVTCKRCNYTELYKGDPTGITDMGDTFVG